MFKKSNFEEEIYRSMEKQLVANQVEDQYEINKLARATDYLNSAAQIFEQAGMLEEATQITEVLQDLSQQFSGKASSI